MTLECYWTESVSKYRLRVLVAFTLATLVWTIVLAE
jgi:hypothetical protein